MTELGGYRDQVPHLQSRDLVLQLRDRYSYPILGRTFNSPGELLQTVTNDGLAVLMKDKWARLERFGTSILDQSVATSSTDTAEGKESTQPTQPQPDTKPSATQQPTTATNKTKKDTVTKPTKDQTENDMVKGLVAAHRVIANVHRRFPHFNQGKLIEELDKLAENDRMSRQTCRKYLSEMVQKGFFFGSAIHVMLCRDYNGK